MSDDILENDPFWKIFFEKIDSTSKSIDETKGASNKAKKLTSVYSDVVKEYFTFVTNLSDKDYGKKLELRAQGLLNAYSKLQEEMLKEHDSKISIEDIGAMSLIPEYSDTAFADMENWEIINEMTEETLARLFSLEFISRIEMFYTMIFEALKFSSITRLENILNKRFNADFSWGIAVAILATQENLVKQKLIELGNTKKDIDQFLKEKGNKFSNLVEWLAREIETKEKRNLRLSFYKSSLLGEMRNTIEHEGFTIKVDKNEVNDLLNDIEKFEKELLPEEKS